MTTFKVGDKVRRLPNFQTGLSWEHMCKYCGRPVDFVFTVAHVNSIGGGIYDIKFEELNSGQYWASEKFELVKLTKRKIV